MNHDYIIGKTFLFEYDTEAYRIEVLTQDELRWTKEQGDNKGETDNESYVFSPIDEHQFMLTWIEATGLGLSNILNLNSSKLITHANLNRDVFVNEGKVNSI